MFEEQIKKLKFWDIGFIKISVALFILWLLGIWPAFMDWVHNTNAWWFFWIAIVLAAFVWYRMFRK